MRWYDRYLRWLYRGGRPNRFARLQNRLSAVVFATGVMRKRAATLQVAGRRSGRLISFPVVVTDHAGQEYLVAMLGERTNWVRNLRSAGGRAVLRRGSAETVVLREVPVEDRPAIIRKFLAVAPGARPHIAVDRHARLQDFEPIAASVPVFRIGEAAAS